MSTAATYLVRHGVFGGEGSRHDMAGRQSEANGPDESRWELVGDWLRAWVWKPRHWLRILHSRIRGPWIKVGDFYEDCSFHVRVCTVSRMSEDYIAGISLIDAHGPSGCSPAHCGVIKVSAKAAMEAQHDPRAYFTKSMAEFGIPPEELPEAVEQALARLDRHPHVRQAPDRSAP